MSIIALIVSGASFSIALYADARSRKAEAVRNLLGEKETVAFGALKLLRDGLPKGQKDRRLVISALLQACVFEGSDRARALLYRVLEANRVEFRAELEEAFESLEQTFRSMDRYEFTTGELDLSRGKRRTAGVAKVLLAREGVEG